VRCRVGKSILLVDDSNTALMMEQMILSGQPYNLLVARDGTEAVSMANKEIPDLILMDIVMPSMNGVEACKALREAPATKEIPIIMVTTRGEVETLEAAFAAGCTDYVTKPIDSAELCSKIRNLIGR